MEWRWRWIWIWIDEFACMDKSKKGTRIIEDFVKSFSFRCKCALQKVYPYRHIFFCLLSSVRCLFSFFLLLSLLSFCSMRTLFNNSQCINILYISNFNPQIVNVMCRSLHSFRFFFT